METSHSMDVFVSDLADGDQETISTENLCKAPKEEPIHLNPSNASRKEESNLTAGNRSRSENLFTAARETPSNATSTRTIKECTLVFESGSGFEDLSTSTKEIPVNLYSPKVEASNSLSESGTGSTNFCTAPKEETDNFYAFDASRVEASNLITESGTGSESLPTAPEETPVNRSASRIENRNLLAESGLGSKNIFTPICISSLNFHAINEPDVDIGLLLASEREDPKKPKETEFCNRKRETVGTHQSVKSVSRSLSKAFFFSSPLHGSAAVCIDLSSGFEVVKPRINPTDLIFFDT